MEQTSIVKAIQSLIKSSPCRTRKPTTLQAAVVEEETMSETLKDVALTQKQVDECDGKSDSTESGDIASDSSECCEQVPGSTYGMSEATTGDFADTGSTVSEPTSGVADVSELDSPSLAFTPSFRPPPGLELFAEADASSEKVDLAVPPGLGAKLNVKAVPFVPTSNLTAPISATWDPSMMLPISSPWDDASNAVLNYLTCLPEEKIVPTPVAEKPFSYVEEAVERMTQDEVAKLRALLDTKDSVKHSICLNDMIVDENAQSTTTTQKTKLSSRALPQQNKSTKQGVGKVATTNETTKPARPPTKPDLEGQTETTLRSNLEELSTMDPARVLMLRKINKLGLRSPSMLNDYFSKFGTVDRVMISHSRAKSIYNPSATRVRIAGLAFVVMSTAEERQAVLDLGQDHVVQGVGICVSEFEGNSSVGGADGTKVLADDHDFNALD